MLPEMIVYYLQMHGYDTLEKIGEGAFGKCYSVRSQKYDRIFACKVLTIAYEMDRDKIMQSFKSEMQVLANVNHPNILRLYDYFLEDKYIFMVLEYCPGSLSRLAKSKPNKAIPFPELLKYAQQIISALKCCHSKRIAHLDIKPSNILMDNFNRPKIGDFGLSIVVRGSEKREGFTGSIYYVCPEIICKKTYDPFKADAWSLGITFYQLAYGKSPWKKHCSMEELKQQMLQGIKHRRHAVEEPLKSIIDGLCQVDPEKRTSILELPDIHPANHLPKITIPANHVSFRRSSFTSSRLSFKRPKYRTPSPVPRIMNPTTVLPSLPADD